MILIGMLVAFTEGVPKTLTKRIALACVWALCILIAFGFFVDVFAITVKEEFNPVTLAETMSNPVERNSGYPKSLYEWYAGEQEIIPFTERDGSFFGIWLGLCLTAKLALDRKYQAAKRTTTYRRTPLSFRQKLYSQRSGQRVRKNKR